MASALGANTRSTGLHCCHKNLQASNLHAFRMNGVHHGYFCGAWSIREIRAEICLGQIFHHLGWGACVIYFRMGAAWLRSTNWNHRDERKNIYSTDFMNEILSLMSKFVSCWFCAPSLRAKACTHALCYLSLSMGAREGLSACSSAHRVTIEQNSMPTISKLLLPKILDTYFPCPLDWALQILHKGYKIDPETSAHPPVARAVWG